MLYHGTSLLRWQRIQDAGHVNPAPCGDKHVSLSTCPHVAARFALSAYEMGEWHGEEDEKGLVVLSVGRGILERHGFKLFPYSSPVWGDGECDWEKEISCLEPIPASLFEVHMLFGPIVQKHKRGTPEGGE